MRRKARTIDWIYYEPDEIAYCKKCGKRAFGLLHGLCFSCVLDDCRKKDKSKVKGEK